MENVWKLALAAAMAAIGAYFRELMVPMAVLLFVMVLYYIAGVSAAWVNNSLDSRTGILGIVKKVSYLLIVAVGMALDYLIHLMGGQFGVTLEGSYFVGLLLIVWLIINECISILENADEMGLPVPGFVKALLKRLKRHTEDLTGEDSDGTA